MPSIIVVADANPGGPEAFQLKERVTAPLLHDPHFAAQLVERVAWAVADAEQVERETPRAESV